MEADDILDDLLSWKDTSARKSGLSTSQGSINVRMGEPSPKAHQDTPLPTLPTEEVLTETVHAPLALPSDITRQLFDYQLEGIQWLYRKHRTGRACLLADEMGLGKTVQVSAFLGALFQQQAIKTAIIVVPPTLVPMWSSALESWGGLTPPLVEVLHNDNKTKRQTRWRRLSHGLPMVFLTTYGVLRQDVKHMSAQMVDYVILDEAHLIKDASTQVSKSAMELSARHKIALTGTPLMNSFEDMWSLFCFLDGGIIGQSRADFRTINNVLLRGNERDASSQQRGEAEAELSKLQAAIVPYMLRREKRDVQAVRSRKQDTVVWVRLTETQRTQYEAFLRTKEVEASRGGDEGTNPLMLLTMLGQICNHPWLNLTDEALRSAVEKPFEAPCEAVGNILSGAKLCVALSLITRAINDQRKVLVFSRSKVLLTLLASRLKDWRVPHTRIDGDCNSEDRFAHVNTFNSDPSMWVCLLTTQVGGVGLTFESASCVILMDPSWNPSADAQAVDRVHRIGQTRDVLVYRLVTSGTVEEKIYRNQVFKTMAAKQSTTTAASTADQNNDLFRYFTRIQLRSMFDFGDLEDSETAKQLAQLHPDKVSAEMLRLPTEVPLVCAVSDNGCVLCDEVTLDDELIDTEEAVPFSQARSDHHVGFGGKRSRGRSTSPPPHGSQPDKRPRSETSDALSSAQQMASMVAELESATTTVRARPLTNEAALPRASTDMSACDDVAPPMPLRGVDAHVLDEPKLVSEDVALPCAPVAVTDSDVVDECVSDAPVGLPALSVTFTNHPTNEPVPLVASVDESSSTLEDPSQPPSGAQRSPQKVLSNVLHTFRQFWA